MTSKETATVLAALRYWQQDFIDQPDEDGGPIDSERFAEHQPLTSVEIDSLCERLNLGGADSTNAKVRSLLGHMLAMWRLECEISLELGVEEGTLDYFEDMAAGIDTVDDISDGQISALTARIKEESDCLELDDDDYGDEDDDDELFGDGYLPDDVI